MRRLLLCAWLLACSTESRAEIALLANGATLKVSGHRVDGDFVILLLKDGGEAGTMAHQFLGFVDDEIVEEVLHGVKIEDLTAGGLESLATETARRHGLPPDLVLAVVAVESDFRPSAISPKGAQGLMQLMPGTATELGVTDPFDPQENLDGGVRHLGALITKHDGDVIKALAAYNAGSAAVQRHGGVPPYPETREYVRKVIARWKRPETGGTSRK
ncbi:MAG: lytic transglycosylase domain-containing protein [Vicinamibacteria bacterium]|nr:lytic transglycosylase domain-containing protein [Vicinamibacteria bacterium]